MSNDYDNTNDKPYTNYSDIQRSKNNNYKSSEEQRQNYESNRANREAYNRTKAQEREYGIF